ncbi:M23 family metallopeptidase [Treponema sp. HNW]|uniref:M23 family metallopeptidase n=1 Tax=Treponema sp. HNW TaxID=3116654 RepID=UPI003D13F85E
MKTRIPRLLIAAVCIAACPLHICGFLFADGSTDTYPRIKKLNFSDPLFKQYSQDVSENYKAAARGEKANMFLYTYKAEKNDDLLSIASRCNIPYETIALLNKLAFIDSSTAEKILYLPTCAGLFIAEKPVTPLEFILKTRYPETEGELRCTVNGVHYVFFPQGRLNPTERFFFADSGMISPLARGVISSAFGTRVSPITGRQSFHRGIDIAAPEGTPVFACKSGITAFIGVDERYGNYIILQHDNNMQSMYAHLKTVSVQTGDTAVKGAQIGTVGNTGLSTGSHLHFEIQVGGKAQDPSSLVKKFLREY